MSNNCSYRRPTSAAGSAWTPRAEHDARPSGAEARPARVRRVCARAPSVLLALLVALTSSFAARAHAHAPLGSLARVAAAAAARQPRAAAASTAPVAQPSASATSVDSAATPNASAPPRALPRAQGGATSRPQVDPAFASPRATIDTFYRNMALYRADSRADKRWLLEAERALDLPSVHAGQVDVYVGESTANDLLYVLDHVLDPSRPEDRDWLRELPSGSGLASTDTQWTWERRVPDSGPDSVVTPIEFTRHEDGRWLVSRATIGGVRDLWDLVRPYPRLVERPLTMVERLRERIPTRFQQIGLLLEHWQWIGLGVLLVLGFLVDRAFRWLSGRLVLRLAGRSRGLLDRDTLSRFVRPVGMFAGAFAVRVLLPLLDLDPEQFRRCDYAVSVFLVVAIGWAAYRLVDVFSGYLEERAALTESKFDDMLVPLLRRTLRIVVLVVGGIFLIVQAGGDLWSVIAGLSVGSLALGFAARDSIENLFGTFTVLLDKPFQLGDVIKLGDLEGSVEQVGLRSTRVRTPTDSIVTVPNRRFISDSVENLGARRARRVRLVLSLVCDTPTERLEALCEAIREILRRHPAYDSARYFVWLDNFGASSLDVVVVSYVDASDAQTEFRERHRLLAAIKRAADELGVSFAYPTQTLLWPRGKSTRAIEPADTAQRAADGASARRDDADAAHARRGELERARARAQDAARKDATGARDAIGARDAAEAHAAAAHAAGAAPSRDADEAHAAGALAAARASAAGVAAARSALSSAAREATFDALKAGRELGARIADEALGAGEGALSPARFDKPETLSPTWRERS